MVLPFMTTLISTYLAYYILKSKGSKPSLEEMLSEALKAMTVPTVELGLAGLSAGTVKENVLGMIKSVNIFVSYSWKDAELADKIESYFADAPVTIKRDKNNIEHWGSIREYMNTIRDTDYVILIISDSYLKSVNCMYEINELIKDKNYKSRIFPLVIEKSIYQLDGRIKYIVYWEKKYEEAKEKIGQIKETENQSKVSKELHLIKEISYSISEFLDLVRDMNNPDKNDWMDSIVDKLLIQKGN